MSESVAAAIERHYRASVPAHLRVAETEIRGIFRDLDAYLSELVPTAKFADVYPSEPERVFDFGGFNVDGGPMSISHWGMIDLGRFGVVYMSDGAHWQEDGKTFAVVA